MGKCTCCGALNKNKTGYSCTGGKSHQCLRIAQPSDASTTVPPTIMTMSTVPSPPMSTLPSPPMSTLPSMPHLVVSLASDEGLRRRQCLNFEHEIVEAQPAPMWLTLLGRYKKHVDAIRSGCFSHYLAWQELVRLGQSGVVLEDDAQRVRPDISYSSAMFPMDGFTLLGGAIRTPGAWARESSEFVENGRIMDVVTSLRPGVNRVQGFRWTNSIAYFLPLDVAKQLIALVDANPKMRIIDIWLNSQKVLNDNLNNNLIKIIF